MDLKPVPCGKHVRFPTILQLTVDAAVDLPVLYGPLLLIHCECLPGSQELNVRLCIRICLYQARQVEIRGHAFVLLAGELEACDAGPVHHIRNSKPTTLYPPTLLPSDL